jgi:hypothetical protein
MPPGGSLRICTDFPAQSRVPTRSSDEQKLLPQTESLYEKSEHEVRDIWVSSKLIYILRTAKSTIQGCRSCRYSFTIRSDAHFIIK